MNDWFEEVYPLGGLHPQYKRSLNRGENRATCVGDSPVFATTRTFSRQAYQVLWSTLLTHHRAKITCCFVRVASSVVNNKSPNGILECRGATTARQNPPCGHV